MKCKPVRLGIVIWSINAVHQSSLLQILHCIKLGYNHSFAHMMSFMLMNSFHLFMHKRKKFDTALEETRILCDVQTHQITVCSNQSLQTSQNMKLGSQIPVQIPELHTVNKGKSTMEALLGSMFPRTWEHVHLKLGFTLTLETNVPTSA